MKEKLKKWLFTPSWSWVWINAALMLLWILDFWMTGKVWTLAMVFLSAASGACEIVAIRDHKKGNEKND